MHDQAKALEDLKTIKRRARITYHSCRSLYETKLRTATLEDRRILYDAISALDAMHGMYSQLKTRMRKYSYEEQIVFAKKWDEYVSCIDTLTAYKTQDKYLLRYIQIESESHAQRLAAENWRDYSRRVRERVMSYS